MAILVPTELVEAAREGDSAVIERLVATIWPDAYRLARAILGEGQGADDAAQEACIILYRTIASLRSADAFRVWFYRIVVREASAIKRQRTRVEPINQAQSYVSDQATSIDIWRALSMLPQHLRDVVVLRYFEDLSSRQIASVLRIPDGTVRFRLMIARQRLQRILGDDFENNTYSAQEVQTYAL